MDNWVIAVFMKAAAIVLLAFVYWVVVYKGSHFLGRFIPNGKFKDFLFRERGDSGPSPAAKLDKRLSDDRTV
ncbi:hypothetical protein SAMN05216569_1053 [Pseudoxanthomonas sp. CF125]|nr:hypothetical protein SAMN05216569_1053 [Pseudoxanthomonas sp. CF125]